MLGLVSSFQGLSPYAATAPSLRCSFVRENWVCVSSSTKEEDVSVLSAFSGFISCHPSSKSSKINVERWQVSCLFKSVAKIIIFSWRPYFSECELFRGVSLGNVSSEVGLRRRHPICEGEPQYTGRASPSPHAGGECLSSLTPEFKSFTFVSENCRENQLVSKLDLTPWY